MPAIITTKLRQQLARGLYTQYLDSPDAYYLAIGRSEEWPGGTDVPPNPLASSFEERKFRESMQSLIRTTAAGYVVPKVTWTANTIYYPYNDNYDDANTLAKPYYVYEEASNNVYICIHQNKDVTGNARPSSIRPEGTLSREFKTADGYVWKFAYKLNTTDNFDFQSANWMRCKNYDSATMTQDAFNIDQRRVQLEAIAGQVIGFEKISGGSGYLSAPAVTIQSPTGTGCAATAVVFGGELTHIKLQDSSVGNVLKMGQGYTNAYVNIIGPGGPGDSAKYRAILSPSGGLGKDVLIDLKVTSVMFNVKPAGTVNNDFITGNKFRQMAVLKNPLNLNSTPFTDNSGRAMKKLKLATPASFPLNSIITGQLSQARAVLDYIGSGDSDYMYVHQTSDTGYTPFSNNDNLTSNLGSGNVIMVGNELPSDINIYSGTLLNVDNRNPVSRETNQTEDLKPIIQF